jgi:predicted nucleotidyltransferase
LERAGLIRSSTSGNAKILRPEARSTIHDEVAGIVLKSYGPAVRLADLLHDASGVRAAYIFGSWAARYSGERGPDPGDIDVLVVVDEHASPAALEDALAAEGAALGREVSVVFATGAEWANASSPFLRTLKSRPLLQLVGDDDVD